MNLKSNPDSGAERFMEISVSLSNDRLDFDLKTLDRVGMRMIRLIINPVVFKATASVTWKSRSSREECRQYQMNRHGNRWLEVEQYAKRMQAGEIPDVGAVFLLRSSTAIPTDGELWLVDGARRLMAFCEAAIKKVDVAVIMSESLTGS